MAGLIDEFTGSSNYIKERPVPFQVTRTFVCYATARTKHLNLHPRVNQDILRYLSEHADKLAEATHFVKGIIYGDKVFCVLIKELDSDDPDQEAKLDAEEKLTKLVMKMEIALEDRQDHVEFKAQFTNKKDKEQLTRVKCRLYSNLHQSQAVRECSFFDAYKECFKFVSKLHDPNVNSSKAIPMVVFLCPLKVIDPSQNVSGYAHTVTSAPTLLTVAQGSGRHWRQSSAVQILFGSPPTKRIVCLCVSLVLWSPNIKSF